MVDKKEVNPVVAGIAGAAIGVAAAGAAVALSDKKNRKKVKNVMDKIVVEGEKALGVLKREAAKLQKDEPPKKLKGKTIKVKAVKKTSEKS
jgi:hypothetical protein